MLEKLSRMEKNYTELADSLSDPAVLADNRLYAEKMREYKRMTPIIETYHAYLHAMQQRDEAKELLQENDGDAELKELAQEEYHTAKAHIHQQDGYHNGSGASGSTHHDQGQKW